jgi:hypothetical protein
MKTNRSKILSYMKKRGYINKRIAAGYHWTYNLGDHIMDLRENHIIETVMYRNPKTKNFYAMYFYRGEK